MRAAREIYTSKLANAVNRCGHNNVAEREQAEKEIEECLSKNADPNRTITRDRETCTLLTLAVMSRNENVVKMLLQHGANVDGMNTYHANDAICGGILSFTALKRATESGRMNMVKLLVEAGANVNEGGNRNVTPLTCSRSAEITRYLISKGANVNAISIYNSSGISDAAFGANVDPINIHNSDAAFSDKYNDAIVECAKILIEAGADIGRTYGMTQKTVLNYFKDRCCLDFFERYEKPEQVAAQTKFFNTVICAAASVQRNNGSDWQSVTNQLNGWLNDPNAANFQKLLKLFDRETVTLLATLIPDASWKDAMIQNFNNRQARSGGRPLNQEKITKLQELGGQLEERFEQLKDSNPSPRIAAILVVADLAVNPHKSREILDYLIGSKSVTPGITNPLHEHVIGNSRLTEEQNLALVGVLMKFFNVPDPQKWSQSNADNTSNTAGGHKVASRLKKIITQSRDDSSL